MSQTEIRNSPIALRLTTEVLIELEMDLVGFFDALPAPEQQIYFDLALNGYEPWERPLVFLHNADLFGIDSYTTALPAHSPTMNESVTTTDSSDRVTYRHGDLSFGAAGDWSPADYQALLTEVPWMRPSADSADELDSAALPLL